MRTRKLNVIDKPNNERFNKNMEYYWTTYCFTLILIHCYVDAAATSTVDPCASPRSIHETERRYIFYQFDRDNRETSVCDKFLTPGWYRLREEDIPTSIPPVYSCGTTYPVWLQGTVPVVADGIVNRTACRHDNSGTCSHSYQIQVKSCGSYRVYNLVPTVTCDEAYCFGTGSDVPAPGITVSSLTVRPCIKHISQGGFLIKSFSIPRLQFSCDFSPPAANNIYYQIYWFKQTGVERYTQYTRVPVKKDNLADTHFLESELGRLNETIRCGVRIKNAIDGRLDPLTRSSDFYAGIKIMTPHVTIGSNGMAPITIKSTIPFGCISVTSSCTVYVELTLPPSCDQTALSNARFCGIQMMSTSWNKEYNMTAEAMTTNQKAGTYTVTLKTIRNLNHAIWSEVTIGSIQIIVPTVRKIRAFEASQSRRNGRSAQEVCTCPYDDNNIPPLPPSPVVNCDANHVITC